MTKSIDSPTGRLLAGLAVTLAAVGVFSFYALRQIRGLEDLQTRTVDRNRKDSLQLLRIQKDLNELGIAMRDMLYGDEPYPIVAWKKQLDRTRNDLDDALRLEAQLAPVARDTIQQRYLAASLAQFWSSAGRMFEVAAQGGAGNDRAARDMIRNSLEAQQGALTSTVAQLLVQNNEAEQEAAVRIQGIYLGVARNVYFFLAAVLLAIFGTTLYLIYSNRRLFQHLAAVSEHRSDLARKLITVQEETLHSLSRELHDEFGQVLTAIGAMLRRAEKRLPADSPFCADLLEVREVAQATLEKTRNLSQLMHPSILDDGGLEKAIDWYLPVFEKQTGIKVRYEKKGDGPAIAHRVAIHVYRVLQEALNNLARHSGSAQAVVRLEFPPGRLSLEVEDRGAGMPESRNGGGRKGIGMTAMRERAELLEGTFEVLRPGEGGTLVRLDVPLTDSYEQ
ncbi:MAG TPA: ATP-binding protein [Bryobacteraceae bacterium]|jgi:signal transduction histidine kinase|nr:ATP-binding protein [Bryobacteraceae bacterium]